MKNLIPLLLLLAAACFGGYLYNKYRVAPNIHPEQFMLNDTEGRQISIVNGSKDYILVNFMATWCGNCINELPSLERLQKIEKEKLEVLCVSDENIDKLIAFKQRRESPLHYAQIQMQGKSYFIHTFPTTYLLNRKGEILYTAVGERVWDSPETADELRALMR